MHLTVVLLVKPFEHFSWIKCYMNALFNLIYFTFIITKNVVSLEFYIFYMKFYCLNIRSLFCWLNQKISTMISNSVASIIFLATSLELKCACATASKCVLSKLSTRF